MTIEVHQIEERDQMEEEFHSIDSVHTEIRRKKNTNSSLNNPEERKNLFWFLFESRW